MAIEYKVIEIDQARKPADIENALNVLGDQNWDLIYVFGRGGVTKVFGVMKRSTGAESKTVIVKKETE